MDRRITKKQHFVPKFYLRRFSDEDKRVQVLDLKRSKVAKPRSYTSICWRELFYAANEGEYDHLSQNIEQFFEMLETSISRDWNGLIDRAKTGRLEREDFRNTAKLAAMLMLRTQVSRHDFNRNQENQDKSWIGHQTQFENLDNPVTAAKYREILGTDYPVDQLKKIQEHVIEGDYTITYNNVPFLTFMLEQFRGFFNILISDQWTVHTALGPHRFITSENPVVEWAPKCQGFYQTGRLGFHKFIALSPEVMIKMAPSPLPDRFPAPGEEWPVPKFAHETVVYRYSSDTDVLVYNFLLTGRGTSYAYAQRRLELDSILSQHSSHGPAYRIYSVALANGTK